VDGPVFDCELTGTFAGEFAGEFAGKFAGPGHACCPWAGPATSNIIDTTTPARHRSGEER
jgi:hypothetical protein